MSRFPVFNSPKGVRLIPLLALGLALSLILAPGAGASGSGTRVQPDRKPSTQALRPYTRATLIDSGRVLFRTCALCHGRDGQGDRCPPLVPSDFVQGDRARLIRYVLRPVDTVRVNGVLWRSTEMPPLETFTDFEVAAALTYIRSLNDSLITCTPEDPQAGHWAECRKRRRPAAAIAADSITPADVAAVRATLPALRRR